jgi:hypothetical protein
MLRGRSGQRGRVRRTRGRASITASLIGGIVVSGLAFSPLAAHASATLSASTTSPVWGATYGAAESAAESQAYQNLMAAAQAHGYPTCINITYSDSLYYVVPGGGGDVFTSTATGQCGTEVLQ